MCYELAHVILGLISSSVGEETKNDGSFEISFWMVESTNVLRARSKKFDVHLLAVRLNGVQLLRHNMFHPS